MDFNFQHCVPSWSLDFNLSCFIDMDYKGQCKNDGRLKTDNIQWNKFRVKERVSLSIKYISLQKHREPWRFYSKRETIMSKMVLFLPTDRCAIALHPGQAYLRLLNSNDCIKLLISLLLLHYSVPHYYLAFESLLLHSLRSPPLQFQ